MAKAIRVENIYKQYRLGQVGTGSIVHDLNRLWFNIRGKEDPYQKIGESSDRTTKSNSKYVLSLRDVSFEVEEGDAVGIIGRNGAGKSTLLKILSRVTAPSSGTFKAKGRISSLLEVGTGFHPDLTGRENIYLNGAILGMRKKEIERRFDEIVDFAGVERYIDTPVKRYSSGMYVRLAFAVAAHLESEILILDEVLAVGDAEFQKKCLGKMGKVSRGEGRTVLFVSHNMAAVKQLCNKGLVLYNGSLTFEGSQSEAVCYYQSSHDINSFYEHIGLPENAVGNEYIRILKFEVKPLSGDIISISSGIIFKLTFLNYKKKINLDATFELRNSDDIPVFHVGTGLSENNNSKQGEYSVKGVLPGYLLNAGAYSFKLIFGENQRYALYTIDNFLQFEVLNESAGSNSHILPGIIRPNIPFKTWFTDELKECAVD